jgi:hypothetical protein
LNEETPMVERITGRRDLPEARLAEHAQAPLAEGAARYLHYSLSTENVYLYWVRLFIRWHGMRHPRDMGAPEVEAFLSILAEQRKVSASTHNQANITLAPSAQDYLHAS